MVTMEKKFALQVPSSTENLVLIREFVSGVGIQAGLSEAEVQRLELAVDEACANVMEHAYAHDETKEVVIRANFSAESLQVVVEDTGKGFDPLAIPEKGVDRLVAERRSGGLGLRLIRQLMEEVHYEHVPGQKNELRMVMRIRKPQAESRE